jgi:hypothetical protein
MGLTEPARPSRPPPSLAPPLGRFLTLIPSGDFESPMSSSPDSGELRRDPPLPYGVSALPHRALPPDCGVSSSSPPIAAIAVELRPVDLAPAAWSTPASLVGASALAPRCLWWPPRHRVGWMDVCNPNVASLVGASALAPWCLSLL